jgi:HK97 family phage prohead protease
MSENLTRAFATDLEVTSGRTVVGIVVPFGQVAEVSDDGRRSYRETFVRGAFARTIAERGQRVRLFTNHDTTRLPLGRAMLLREDAAGLYGEFRVSETQAGDEALALLRDGALDSFSVGFRKIAQRMVRDVVERTEVGIREASLVSFPAYSEARVLAVRNATQPALTVARRRLELARLALIDPDKDF